MDGLSERPAGLSANYRSWFLVPAVLLALSFGLSGCTRALNSPREVTGLFLDGISQGSVQALDTLVDWESVVLRSDYVTSSYFSSLDMKGKDQVTRTYKEVIFSKFLPPLARATFNMKQVGESRGDADCWIEVKFAGNKEENEPGHEMAISLKYDKTRRRWIITDLGDLPRLAMLNGEFDPRTFYLQQPTEP